MSGSNAGARPQLARLVVGALFLGSLIAVFGGPLVSHIRISADPLVFSNDVCQQVYPFLRSEGRGPIRSDYVADYYISAVLPAGYKALYGAAARLGLVRELNRWLPYVLLLLTVATVGVAAYRFGGLPAAWISAALALSSGDLGNQGGLPRSFAFPIVAGIILALVRGSVAGLAGLAVASALFYPVTAVISGLSLFFLLFVPGASPEGRAASWGVGRSWRRRQPSRRSVPWRCRRYCWVDRGMAIASARTMSSAFPKPVPAAGTGVATVPRSPGSRAIRSRFSRVGCRAPADRSRPPCGNGWIRTPVAGGSVSSWARCLSWPPRDGFGCRCGTKRLAGFSFCLPSPA